MQNINTKSKKYYIHSAITIAIMLLFPLLPNIGQITDLGMRVLGVTLGLLYGWIFVELCWPSILGLLVFGSLGISSVTETFSSIFGNSTLVLSFMFFAFSQMMNELRVTNYIAGKMLSFKFILGKPWAVVSMVLMTSYVLAFLTDTVPAIFLTWSFALAITDMSGYDRKSPLVGFLLCGIPFGATLGGMVLPFKITSIVFVNFLTQATGQTIDFFKFIVFMGATSLLVMAVLILIGRFILKLDASKIVSSEEALSTYNEAGTFNQKLGLVLICAFIVILLLPSFFSAEIPFIAFLKSYSTIGCLGFLIIIPAIMRDEQGEAIVSIRTMMKGVSWDIIWLLAAIMTLPSGLNLPEAGIMATISSVVMPLVQNMSPILLIALSGLLMCLITQFITNFVVGAMFIPFIIPICAAIGGNTVICFFIMYWGLMLAFATPAASMTAALMHGHENVSSKQAYGYGLLYMAIGLLVAIGIGLPIGSLLF